MPQADIGIVPSTVFFLFLSFLLGYLCWVNFIFPRLITLTRIKGVVQTIEEKDFFGSLDKLNDGIVLSRLEKVSNSKFIAKYFLFLAFDPALVLDLPADEIPLIINFVLISLSFYFVLSGMLSKAHSDSRDFVKTLCNFEFSSTIEEANTARKATVKYLRSSSLLGFYELSQKWVNTRKTLVLPIVKSSVVESSISLLSEIALTIAAKKSLRLGKLFKDVKIRQSKLLNSLFIARPVKTFRLKSNKLNLSVNE